MSGVSSGQSPVELPTEHGQTVCHHCQAPLAAQAQTCPACGRRQYRTCFCGTPVRSDLPRCPVCDTDWSSLGRLRRRSRSSRVRPRTLLRSAALGAALTVLISGVLNLLITALAQRSIPVGSGHVDFSGRLYYAWCTVANGFMSLFTRVLGGAAPVLATAAAGAVVGVLWCLIRSGYLRAGKHAGRPGERSGPTRRRRSH